VIAATQPLPVTIPNVHGGLSEARGTVVLDDLTLVFDVAAYVLYQWGLRPTTVRLDVTDLDSVAHRRGLTNDTLTLRTLDSEALRGLPGAQGHEVKLTVARKDRDALDALLPRLRLWIR
jgi:hypothetical protein